MKGNNLKKQRPAPLIILGSGSYQRRIRLAPPMRPRPTLIQWIKKNLTE